MKTLIGIGGIVLLLYGLTLRNNLQNSEVQATKLDGEKHAFAVIGDDAPPPCNWEVTEPERVMAENKSQAVVVKTTNNEKKPCESYLSLRAPSFDLSPAKEEQHVTLPAGDKGSVSWILTPRKTGTYEVAVSDIIDTKIFGIAVTNVFGLTAAQAKVFATLSSLLGPMLTVPWWVDKWFQRKKKDIKKEDLEKKDS